MVPRIAEYRVAEAGWDDTVIPTVARKMQGDGVDAVAGGDADQLVAEWTPDGKPVRLERVGGKMTRGAVRDDGVHAGMDSADDSVRLSHSWNCFSSLIRGLVGTWSRELPEADNANTTASRGRGRG